MRRIIDRSASLTDNASSTNRQVPNLVRFRPPDVCLPARPPERAVHDAMVMLLAQAARAPLFPPHVLHLVVQIVLLGLRHQNLRLLRQARHVHKAFGRMARAPAHKTLAGMSMDGLKADVARLVLRVLGARLRRNRDGRRTLLIRIVLLGAACFFYFPTELVVPAFFPVLHLAGCPAVARAAAAAFLAQG